MKKLKSKVKRFLTTNKATYKLSRKLINAKRKHTYRQLQKTLPLEENTILFESYQGRLCACSPKAMFLEAVNNPEYAGYNFIWAVRNPKAFGWLKAYPNTRLVKYGTKGYLKTLVTSKYWVTNSTMPPYAIPGEHQVFVQTWHGTPLKRLGCDLTRSDNKAQNLKTIHKQYITQGNRITHFLSPSEFYTQKIGSCYAQGSEKFIPCGYPRNDFLFSYTPQDVARVKEALGIPQGKKVLLYAPTFRDNNFKVGSGFQHELGLDFDMLKEAIGGEFVVLFRAHYFIANRLDLTPYQGFVFDVSKYNDINELYIISDMLMTDYSSVFFDYANLHRPMLFYMYDYQQYKTELRDFYLDVSTLPGPIVYTNQEVGQAVLELNRNFEYNEAYKAFNQTYNTYNDAHSSLRALNACIKYEVKNKE